ncbi:hypothetical protein G6O67_003133 [Ophiocordyceps sinensis]|uniref:Uncharacterized protein n=1 Tax=Ophiocordyceps sinensis TaxID=72228 RepID=A0A8H4V8A2_9HYPO|nr:hypothetical protein G6O67_003133 [Ophiocordyceps sinensis]
MDLGRVVGENHATPTFACQQHLLASRVQTTWQDKPLGGGGHIRGSHEVRAKGDAPPYSVPAKGKPPFSQAARHFLVVNGEPSTLTGQDSVRPLLELSVKQPRDLNASTVTTSRLLGKVGSCQMERALSPPQVSDLLPLQGREHCESGTCGPSTVEPQKQTP